MIQVQSVLKEFILIYTTADAFVLA